MGGGSDDVFMRTMRGNLVFFRAFVWGNAAMSGCVVYEVVHAMKSCTKYTRVSVMRGH